MSSFSSTRFSKINIPLTGLWLAAVICVVLGYFLMSSSNSDQAALYNAQSANYGKLFEAQSGSTVGGMLIAVGVLGLLLALTAQTITRARVTSPDVVALDTTEVDNENDDEPAEASAPEVETAATDAADLTSGDAADAEPATAR